MAKNEVAKVNQNTAMEAVPDYLKGNQSRGNEQVSAADLVIPRIELVQSLSPCRKKTDPAYIEGAEEGDLYNNVTRELYGREVKVIPVFFAKEFLLWKDRTKGGGFKGAFPTAEAAQSAREALGPEGDDVEIVDTAQQYVLVARPDGRMDEAVISMAKSKAKVSRQWNSLIRLNANDRFSRVYNISSVADKSDKGEFHNFKVANVGYVTEDQYRRAEKTFQIITEGKATIDRTVDVSEGAASSEY
jgi:hypothetical protein